MIFSVVVYWDGLDRDSSSWTCRTVNGPRSHRMFNTSSCASVGLGWSLVFMYDVCTTSLVVESSLKEFIRAHLPPWSALDLKFRRADGQHRYFRTFSIPAPREPCQISRLPAKENRVTGC